MLVRCLLRRPTIYATLGQRLVFAIRNPDHPQNVMDCSLA